MRQFLRTMQRKMCSTPLIDELREACGSDKFHHALRLCFLHDEADNKGLALVLIERSDDLRVSIGKKYNCS